MKSRDIELDKNLQFNKVYEYFDKILMTIYQSCPENFSTDLAYR